MHGDRPHQLLASLLNSSRARQSILEARPQDGNMVTDHETLLKYSGIFTQNFNTSESQTGCNAINDFLPKLNIPEIPPELKTRLDDSTSQSEVSLATASMQSGKCPGPDGFPSEFLIRALHYCLRSLV